MEPPRPPPPHVPHRTLSKLPHMTYSYNSAGKPSDETCPPGPIGPPPPDVSGLKIDIRFEKTLLHPGEWLNAVIILHLGSRIRSTRASFKIRESEIVGEGEYDKMHAYSLLTGTFWNVPEQGYISEDVLPPTDEFRYMLPGTYEIPFSAKIPEWSRSTFEYRNCGMSDSHTLKHKFTIEFSIYLFDGYSRSETTKKWRFDVHRHNEEKHVEPVKEVILKEKGKGTTMIKATLSRSVYNPGSTVVISRLAVNPTGGRLTSVQAWIRPVMRIISGDLDLDIKYASFKHLCPHKSLFNDPNGTSDPKSFDLIELCLPTIDERTKFKDHSYPLPYATIMGFFCSVTYEVLVIAIVDGKPHTLRVPFTVAKECCTDVSFTMKSNSQKPLYPARAFELGPRDSPYEGAIAQREKLWKEVWREDPSKLTFQFLKEEDSLREFFA